jgi:hypothetical protein
MVHSCKTKKHPVSYQSLEIFIRISVHLTDECNLMRTDDVLTALNMSLLIFWVVILCGLVGRYMFWWNILPPA